MEVEKMGSIQMHTAKLVKGISKLSYEERLRYLKLPTLKYRRTRGDMILLYKMISV